MGEGNYPIPILLFVPKDNREKHPALVYIHSEGKVTDAIPGGEIENLVRRGYVVAATDVLGVGETKNTAARDVTDGYTGVSIGRSVVGIQAGDIVRAVNYLKSCSEVDPMNIGAVGINELCIPLIHAAAFEPSIKNITLINPLISYRSIVMNRLYKIGLTPTGNKGTGHPYEVDFSWGVAGVLKAYDLPDLIGCIAPRKVAMINIKDQTLESVPEEIINQEMAFPRLVYSGSGAAGNLKIISQAEDMADMVDWGFR